MGDLLLCKDCEHKNGINCHHPALVDIDLVTGQPELTTCSFQRYNTGGRCSYEGRYYSSKWLAKEKDKES